jgi:signal transduction histidine kinase
MIDTNYEVFEDASPSPHQRLGKLRLRARRRAPADLDPHAARRKAEEGPFVPRSASRISGRGLDPEIRDHAFEPFTSTKNTVGVGMGLTVARHALRNLGRRSHPDRSPGRRRHRRAHSSRRKAHPQRSG